MAQLNFNAVEEMNNNQAQQNNGVGFFSLKNDGDEAIVRIMHDSVDTFDLVSKHQVKVNNRFININCIREPSSPIDTCPLCAAGYNLENKIFIHMLRYTRDQNGKVTCQPVVWERSLSYARQLQSLINEYGPLSNCIFKITRHGIAGSRDTTYSILFGNPMQYNEQEYVKDYSAFENYKALGRAVLNKDANDISTFLQTGDFPKKQNTQQQASQPQNTFNQQYQMNQQATTPQNTVHTPNNFNNQQNNGIMTNPFSNSDNPFSGGDQQVQRPVRYY